MNTIVNKVSENYQKNKAVFNKAANILKNDGLVAFPTETVYGLGCNAFSDYAINKVFIAKGRPLDNPLIVHICNLKDLNILAKDISKKAIKLIENFWPGPLTLIFNKKDDFHSKACGGLKTIAIRMPSNTIAQRLIETSNFPICAPSANMSGRPSPTSAKHVYKDLNNKIDMIIDGGFCDYGIESTVIDVSEDKTHILRPGSITKEMIEQVIGKVYLDKYILNDKNLEYIKTKSPGMKYKHYAPNTKIFILKGSFLDSINKINEFLKYDSKAGVLSYVISFDEDKIFYNTKNILNIGTKKDLNLVAKNLFNYLHLCDKLKIDKAYFISLKEEGIGLAIMNRLKKASGYNIINV